MNTIDVQEVFNKVIDSGFYEGDLMCFALSIAAAENIITMDKCLITKNTIEDYIGEHMTLGVALVSNKLPHESPDRMTVYKDWANRPTRTH